VILVAPSVDSDTAYSITANKTGYLNNQTTITILNSGGSPPPPPPPTQLVISNPSSITEGITFYAIVSANGHTIEGATVYFNNHSYNTIANGSVQLTAPQVEQNTLYIISATKTGYQNGASSITVVDEGQPPLPPPGQPLLLIHASTSVIEGTSFWITVTANEATVQLASITFNEKTYFTNSEGKVQLTAPFVNADTEYSIVATKSGYQFHSIIIKVINQETIVEKGWIYGTIKNSTGALLEAAQVCVILSIENNVVTSTCTLTNESGAYNISIPIGTYSVQASKEGYQTSSNTSIQIIKNTGFRLNFTLKNETQTNKGPYLIDYAMNQIINQGIISGTIDIQSQSQQEGYYTHITTFDEPVSINLRTITQKTLTFTISAPNGTLGKIITIRFGPGTLNDMKNVTIIYDDAPIPWVDFDTIFTINETNTDARWTSVLAIDGTGNEILYCLVWVPHFSDHTISITTGQIIQTLGTILSFSLYIAIIVILAVLTAIPIIRLWRKIE
jgi:hypothetical protein